MRKLVLAVVVSGLLVACGTTGETTAESESTDKPKTTEAANQESRPGNPKVYARIEAMTDCGQLQEQFDIAEANQFRDIDRGRTDLAEASTAYMQAADERMREVGCYK
jgi:peptidyl-tRNA hydrolase